MIHRIHLSPFGDADDYAALRAALTANGMPATEGPVWYLVDVEADYDDLCEWLEDECFDLSETLVETVR